MENLPQRNPQEFAPNGPGHEDLLEEAAMHFDCSFPIPYKRFMTKSDGGEGFLGDEYLILWRAAELIDFNRDYEVAEYAPGLLIFGSNGGGEAFAFDTRNSKMGIVMVPFIGMDLKHVKPVADTFEDFLSTLANGTLF